MRIQLIPGWEGFVRRLIDSEPIDVVISGAEQLDLVVLDPPHRRLDLPAGVRLIPAVEWLLELG